MLRSISDNIPRDSKTPSFSKLIDFVKKLVQDAPHLATETWPLLLPFIIFVGFVITNKGIVVGKILITLSSLFSIG